MVACLGGEGERFLRTGLKTRLLILAREGLSDLGLVLLAQRAEVEVVEVDVRHLRIFVGN